MPDAREIEVSGIRRIPGGASRETWSLDASWTDGNGRVESGFIIRRDPVASVLETERYVEFRVYQAMQGTGVPVPEMCWLETDQKWLERPFFVMGRLQGEASPQAMVAGALGDADAIAQQKCEILARIHNVDWRERGLEELGPPADERACGAMEIDRWYTIMHKEALEPQPVLEMAFAWLRKRQPVAQKISVVHGDYRTGNFLVHEGTVTGVLDWEMAHLGDPLEDVAWACLRCWRWAGDARIGGLLPRAEFYRRYEAAGGPKIDEESVRFWEVLGNCKMAIISLTGARSYASGLSCDAIHAFTAYLVPDIELEVLRLIE
jgi:aminoglycoside phosphotransferase (APT) family kinase protein